MSHSRASQMGSQSPYQPEPRARDAQGMTGGAAPSEVGLIVLSASGRMLHMNGEARNLMALFGEAHELWPHLAPDSLPSILAEFCRDVFAQLQGRIEHQDWAQLEMQRVCHMVTPPLLLRGFGVPHSSQQEPRMILTLQPVTPAASTQRQTEHVAHNTDSPADRHLATS